jgi:hypothetical protein
MLLHWALLAAPCLSIKRRHSATRGISALARAGVLAKPCKVTAAIGSLQKIPSLCAFRTRSSTVTRILPSRPLLRTTASCMACKISLEPLQMSPLHAAMHNYGPSAICARPVIGGYLPRRMQSLQSLRSRLTPRHLPRP